MITLIDLLIVNISAVLVFILREVWGHFPNQPPSYFFGKYGWAIFFLNILYFFLFWMLGAYDRRQKRALLEEFVMIFGVISTGLFVLITFLFMGQMWWMSRGILYMFWALSIISLCVSRIIYRSKSASGKIIRSANLEKTRQKLMQKKKALVFSNTSLSIVVVTYNSIDKLKKCLNSIKEADLKMPHTIIIVDNNSSDGTAEYVKNNYPRIKLVKNMENYGYSRAVNIGLKSAPADFYLISNPDMTLIPGSIEVVLDHMLQNPGTGLSSCKLLNTDGSLQYSARRFLDLRTYLYRFTPIRGLMKGSAIERSYLMQDWDHNDNRAVDWVLGGLMLLRKEAYDKVGPLDENIFLYFEDVDLCFRMWDLGWQIDYISEAVVIHEHIRASANKIFNRATYEHIKSLFYFLRKHGLNLPKNCPSSVE